MATSYATNSLLKNAPPGMGWAYAMKKAWGVYQISDSGPMAANSAIYMCKIPKGAYITGGRVYGDPLDSSGTGSALASIHVGVDVTCVGTDATVYGTTSTTAILTSSQPLGPDAVASVTYKATNTRNFPFGGLVLTNGPLNVLNDANVIVTWTASALALTTGYLRIEVDYYASVDS